MIELFSSILCSSNPQKTETEFAFQLDDPKAAITSFEVCMLSDVVVDLRFLL